MNKVKIDYLFLDPFSSSISGVSNYIIQASSILKKAGYSTQILRRYPNENIDIYRKRASLYVRNNEIGIIEAPETLTSTKYISHPYIHIRLHCSKAIGNYMQDLNVDYHLIEQEQIELNKAKYISAPSSITLIASKLFFSNLDNAIVFPHPYKHTNTLSAKPSTHPTVFFIGRGEALKGIFFLENLHINHIHLVGDKKLQQFAQQNLTNFTFINGSSRFSLHQIKPYDIILLPSLFETWSMVAVEAISRYAKILTWQHIGICEFFPAEVTNHCKPWDMKAFEHILEILKQATPSSLEISNYKNQIDSSFNLINDEYFNEVVNIIENTNNKGIKQKLKNINTAPLLPHPFAIKQHEKSSTMRIKKKLNKFTKNPSLFFSDSKFIPDFLKKKHPFTTSIKEETGQIAKEELKQKPLSIEAKPKANLLLSTSNPPKTNHKIGISPSGFLTFPKIESKKTKLQTIFLYPNRLKQKAEALIQEIYKHTDFLPMRENELITACYPDHISHTPLNELALKMNNDNKQRLSSYPNIFILDNTENLGITLHYSNHQLHIAQIFDGDNGSNFITDTISDILTYYLYPQDLELNLIPSKRKLFSYSSDQELSVFIRKILQEIIPRDVNLLLPVIANNEYRPELLKLNIENSYNDIYAKVNKFTLPNYIINHNQLCTLIAENTIELFVTESTFLRYQNLLSTPSLKTITDFYNLSSQDGLRFEIIYENENNNPLV